MPGTLPPHSILPHFNQNKEIYLPKPLQILEAIGVDYIDESEVLTPADHAHHVEKHPFSVPFVCGCRNLGEALRRISEGAAMIRTKGEAGTGDIVNAVTHMRAVFGHIRRITQADSAELYE